MIQIFLTDGRILVDVNCDLESFSEAITSNYTWVQIHSPNKESHVIAINQIVSFKEVNLE